MITTVGKIIRVDLICDPKASFIRQASSPGLVTMHLRRPGGGTQIVELPGTAKEAETLIMAYRRVIEEDIDYKEYGDESDSEKIERPLELE